METKWPELVERLPSITANFMEGNPRAGAAFKGLQQAAFHDGGTLSVRTKELIAAALAIASRCDGCIAHHVHACVELGCTRDEFVEMAAVAVLMGGGPSQFYGSRAIEAFDQFTPSGQAEAGSQCGVCA